MTRYVFAEAGGNPIKDHTSDDEGAQGDAQMSYNRDTVGRVTSVAGSGFPNVSTYASSIKYRAWGGQKSITYDGDGTSATTSYNSRMQPSSYLLPSLRVKPKNWGQACDFAILGLH